MLLKTLFPHLRHFRVDSLVKEEQQITLVCVSTRKQAACPRRIFTERLPGLCQPYGKQKLLRKQVLEHIGLALGGQARASQEKENCYDHVVSKRCFCP